MKRFDSLYNRHRFPPEIIQHAVWLYYRFNMSSHDIEGLLAERGVSMPISAQLYARKSAAA